MLRARIELQGEDLFCADTGEGGASSLKPLSPEALSRLEGWSARYDAAVRSRAAEPLVEIGRDIADFLNDAIAGSTGFSTIPGRSRSKLGFREPRKNGSVSFS